MHVWPSIRLYLHPYRQTRRGRKGNPDMATWVCPGENQTSLATNLLICSMKNLEVIYFKQGTCVLPRTHFPLANPVHLTSSESYLCLCRQFLMPGFVDTHIHAPQYVFTGTGYDLPLLDWLEKYTFPSESRFRNVEFAQVAYRKVVVSEH